MEPVTTILPARPTDATLSVTKAAQLLGVHPNTIRAWSDQGRLRYYRINPRGDRRYRLGDLQRLLTAAEVASLGSSLSRIPSGIGRRQQSLRAALARPGAGARSDTALGAPILDRRRNDQGGGAGSIHPDLVSNGPLERERHRLDLRVLTDLAALSVSANELDRVLARATETLREAYGHQLVAVYELTGERLVVRAASGSGGRPPELPRSFGTIGRALAAGRATLVRAAEASDGWGPVMPGAQVEWASPIVDERGTWGVLLAVGEALDSLGERDSELLDAVAGVLAVAVHSARLATEAAHQVHRLDALRRVASDIGSKLDLDQILAGLVDHAMVLFGADRAAVFLRQPDDTVEASVARGLSESYLASVRDFPSPSLGAASVAARRPLFATGYADDPRGGAVRAAVIQEGFDTICSAPLFDGATLLGLLCVYHDRPHVWSTEELDTMDAFATQASVAIKTAQNYSQMATWAAQLQSIQQLGARLNRLTSIREIGNAIATELRQLLDFHNVRVYSLEGVDDLIPVAFQGQVGEYVDETPEQLRTKVGIGITGWVALNKEAQNLPDAAADPRASTIAGTEDDLDESMLLAPMIFEEQVVGVVVLSKLGLNQFTDDDMRLLVIYASFAAQAFANADATEQLRSKSIALERQVRSQRELLQITESILTTLDSRAVLDQITDRLGGLVQCDNISIELLDRKSGMLRPLTAKGINADEYLQPWLPGEEGIATWVVANNEPQLIVDERTDARVVQFREVGPVEGSIICVPLRDRDGAVGVLTLERLGGANRFSEDEFELVKLFAAQVSIALQNAEAHRAVEVMARTDNLTGLLNHGTFQDWLARSVVDSLPFSLIMIDLDDFKSVNDALGHQAGDRLLREIADAIVGAGRETDHVFRYGGDEFVLLLPGTEGDGAAQVAERVRAAVRLVGGPGSPWHSGGLKISASVGLATFPSDGATAQSILLAADRACFVAKRTGPGLIATADEGRALAAEFSLQEPTPVDPPSVNLS